MRKWVFVFFCLALLLLCSSCRSTRTVIEYLPAEIDLTDTIAPIFAMRPDNDVEIIVDVQDIADVVKNSAVYLRQWELWQSYAVGLEEVLIGIQQTYGSGNGSSGACAED